MNYNKRVEKIIDKIKGKNFNFALDNMINGLSTGGPVERSYKKNVGDIVNKNIDERYNSKVYKAIQKAYEKITSGGEK